VVRTAKPKPADLVALRGGRILPIECKYDTSTPQKHKEFLMKLARRAEDAGANKGGECQDNRPSSG